MLLHLVSSHETASLFPVVGVLAWGMEDPEHAGVWEFKSCCWNMAGSWWTCWCINVGKWKICQIVNYWSINDGWFHTVENATCRDFPRGNSGCSTSIGKLSFSSWLSTHSKGLFRHFYEKLLARCHNISLFCEKDEIFLVIKLWKNKKEKFKWKI